MLKQSSSHLVGYSGVDAFGQASMVAFPPPAAMPRIPIVNLSLPSNGRVAATPAPLPITMLAPGMVLSPTGPTPRTINPGAMLPTAGGSSSVGAWWDGLSTVGKVGVVGGGALLLLGIAYGLTKTSKSTNEAFRPNRSRRRQYRRNSSSSDKDSLATVRAMRLVKRHPTDVERDVVYRIRPHRVKGPHGGPSFWAVSAIDRPELEQNQLYTLANLNEVFEPA